MPQLIIEVLGDASNLNRTFRRVAKDTKTFEGQITGVGRSITKAFAAVGVGVGVASLVDGLKSSVDAASDLNEQMSKTGVVFGTSADSVKAWSRSTATSLGLSQRAALATASSFGALFAPLGIAGDQAAEQSKKLTQLGADLASFYNTDVQSALDAIRSGLLGESEPLRKYGVILSEARVQQEALTETGKKNAKQLTDQEKVVARIALVYKDTKQAQGDFARTSGGLANQQRILTAQIDDLRTKIGRALLPDVLKIVSAINKWLAKSQNQKRVTDAVRDAVRTLHDVLKGIRPIVEKVADLFKTFAKNVGGTKDAVKLLGTAFATYKIATWITGIGTSAGRSSPKLFGFAAALAIIANAKPPADKSSHGFQSWSGKGGWGKFFNDIAGLVGLDWKGKPRVSTVNVPALFMAVTAGQVTVAGIRQLRDSLSDADYNALLHHAQQVAKAGRTGRPFGTSGAGTAGTPAPKPKPKTGRTATELAQQRNEWFDAMIGRELDRVQDIPTLRRQIARLKEIAKLVTDRIAATKDITRRLTLGDTLRDINRQIADDKAEVAQNTADAYKAAAEKEKAAAKALSDWVKRHNEFAKAQDKAQAQDFLRRKRLNEERKKREKEQEVRDRTAAQFSVLGLGPTGQEIITRRGLAAQLKRIREDIKGTTLNTDKTRARLKAIYSVIVSGVHGMSREVRETVKSMLDDIDQQLADAPKRKKKGRRMVGGIYVDKYGNAIGPGLPSGRNDFYNPYTAVNKFTGAVKDATAALNTLDKLRIFADLRQFGGNLWSRAGVAALGGMGGGGMAGNRLQMPRVNMWGTGRPDTSGIFGGSGRGLFGGGVTVHQHFNAPTTDRHREARYALAATRAVFDT